MRQPAFPQVGESPDQQRLYTELQGLVRQLLTAGFLIRPDPGNILRGASVQLSFGSWNRMLVPTGVAMLPAIKPTNIGVPLYATKLVASGTTRFVAQPPALVNSVPTGVPRSAIGVQVLWNDGTNWWT